MFNLDLFAALGCIGLRLVVQRVARNWIWPSEMFRHQFEHSLARWTHLLRFGPRNQFL